MNLVHQDKTDLNPVRLEGTRKEDIAALKKRIHAAIDAFLDGVEYDAHGEAVNRIVVREETDAFQLPVMEGVDIHLPVMRRLSLEVSTTYRAIREEMARLDVKDAVDVAERSSKGYVVMRQGEPDAT